MKVAHYLLDFKPHYSVFLKFWFQIYLLEQLFASFWNPLGGRFYSIIAQVMNYKGYLVALVLLKSLYSLYLQAGLHILTTTYLPPIPTREPKHPYSQKSIKPDLVKPQTLQPDSNHKTPPFVVQLVDNTDFRSCYLALL